MISFNNSQPTPYKPSAAAIAAACQEIQKRWSHATRLSRQVRGRTDRHATIRQYSVAYGSDGKLYMEVS